MSATFLSPPIFLTKTIPSSILSCAHSVLVSRCLTFPKPFLVAIPDVEVEAHVLRNPLDPQGLTHALDYSAVLGSTARVRHHGLCRSPSLQQVAPVHDQTSIGGPPCARAPSVVGVDVHLEVGLDILPCKPQHLSGVFPQVSLQLSNLGPVHISLLANCTSTLCMNCDLSAARKLSLAAMDLNLYQLCVCLVDIHFVTSHIGPIRTLESQFFDDQVDMSRIRFVLDSGIGPLHDPIQDCHGLHVMEVWPTAKSSPWTRTLTSRRG